MTEHDRALELVNERSSKQKLLFWSPNLNFIAKTSWQEKYIPSGNLAISIDR